MRYIPKVVFALAVSMPVFAQYEFEMPQSSSSEALPASSSSSSFILKKAVAPAAAPTAASDEKPGTAAWSAALLGNPAAGPELKHWLESGHHFSGNAVAAVQIGSDTAAATVAYSLANGSTVFMDMGLDSTSGNQVSRYSAGYATGLFSVGLRFSFDRTSTHTDDRTDDDIDTDNSAQNAGDGFGVFGSFQAGAADIFAGLDLLTYTNSSSVQEAPGGKIEMDRDDILLRGGFRMPFMETQWFESRVLVRFRGDNDKITTEDSSYTTKYVDDGVLFRISAAHGVRIKDSDGLRVLVGEELGFNYQDFSGANAANSKDSSWVGMDLRPNISLEYQFTEKVTGIAGASHLLTWDFEERSNGAPTASATSVESSSTLHQNPTTVVLGARYDFGRVAAEATIANAALNDGTSSFFNGTNVLARIGVVADIR